MNDTVAADLADLRDPGAGQLFAHQHAQRRRFQRVGIGSHGQMAPGVVRRGAQEQSVIRASRADHQHDRVPLRLGDLIDPSACERLIQFPGGESHRQPVHRHESLPHFSVKNR